MIINKYNFETGELESSASDAYSVNSAYYRLYDNIQIPGKPGHTERHSFIFPKMDKEEAAFHINDWNQHLRNNPRYYDNVQKKVIKQKMNK
jgi:hypothetical protein